MDLDTTFRSDSQDRGEVDRVQLVSSDGHFSGLNGTVALMLVAYLVPVLGAWAAGVEMKPLTIYFAALSGLPIGMALLARLILGAKRKGLIIEGAELVALTADGPVRFDRRRAVLGTRPRGKHAVEATVGDGFRTPVAVLGLSARVSGRRAKPATLVIRDGRSSWKWHLTAATWNGDAAALSAIVADAEGLEPVPTTAGATAVA